MLPLAPHVHVPCRPPVQSMPTQGAPSPTQHVLPAHCLKARSQERSTPDQSQHGVSTGPDAARQPVQGERARRRSSRARAARGAQPRGRAAGQCARDAAHRGADGEENQALQPRVLHRLHHRRYPELRAHPHGRHAAGRGQVQYAGTPPAPGPRRGGSERAGAEAGWPMQIDPVKYKSISEGFKLTVREAGTAGLFRGWFPTLLGYSVQGAGKFGLYEYFKKCGPVACAAPPALIGADASLRRSCTAPSPARCARRHDYAGGARAGSTPTWPARRMPSGTRRVSSWQARRPPSSSPTLACARSRRSRCARSGTGSAGPVADAFKSTAGRAWSDSGAGRRWCGRALTRGRACARAGAGADDARLRAGLQRRLPEDHPGRGRRRVRAARRKTMSHCGTLLLGRRAA